MSEPEDELWGGEVDGWKMKKFLTNPLVLQAADKLQKAVKEVYDQFLELENIEGDLYKELSRRYSRPMPSGGGHMAPGHPMTTLDSAHWMLNGAVRAIFERIGQRYPDD